MIGAVVEPLILTTPFSRSSSRTGIAVMRYHSPAPYLIVSQARRNDWRLVPEPAAR